MIYLKTIKEIADLVGVSVRTLQYYDELGVLKPTKVNEAGYRFYDDAALEKLQQILFFRELDFPLKEIKGIMENVSYDKVDIFKKQRELLTVKRDRLNRLLNLLERLEKGENVVSFKEFDMSEYIKALEQFRSENEEEVIKYWGSVELFNEFIQKVKEDETMVAKRAISQYGSVEKYTEAMKYNLEHFSEIMEQIDGLKENANAIVEESDCLYRQLTADLSKNVGSDDVQETVKKIVEFVQRTTYGQNMGSGYWNMVIEGYNRDLIKKITDQKYGSGASEYIAKALKFYFDNRM